MPRQRDDLMQFRELSVQFQLPGLSCEKGWLSFKLFMSVWDGFFQTQTGFQFSSVPPKQHFMGETVCSSYDPREGRTDCDLGINTSYLWLRSMDQSHGCLCWWRNGKSWGHRAPSCDHTSYTCGHSYDSCLSLLKNCIMADMSYDRHCWTS